MKYLSIVFLAFLLFGCTKNGYKQFYKSYVDAKTLSDVELLGKGEEPKIYGTDNFEKDIQILRSKKYIAIGHSSFNGAFENAKNAVAQAKRIGATIILTNSKFTNTQTTTRTLFLPDRKTTYNSGNASSNTTYNSPYRGYLGSSSTNTTYSGTSTTYGTKIVPITSEQRRYDQTAVYLVKSTKKLKFGVSVRDLTPNQRVKYERNTGVLVEVVVEDSPAFYSNVIAGDVLIAINGIMVKNYKQAIMLMSTIDPKDKSAEVTVIRKGKEKNISVKF